MGNEERQWLPDQIEKIPLLAEMSHDAEGVVVQEALFVPQYVWVIEG